MLEPVVSQTPTQAAQNHTLTKYRAISKKIIRRRALVVLKISVVKTENKCRSCKMDRRLRLLLLPVTLATLYLFTSSLSLLSRCVHPKNFATCNFLWNHAILEFCLISRSFRLLSSHLDQDELLASARMTSPVIGLAIGILATSLLQVI